MDIVSLVIEIILGICAVGLIVVVLMQSSDKTGLGSLAGETNNSLSKTKVRGKDAILSRLTKILGIVFMILAVGLVLIQRFFMNA